MIDLHQGVTGNEVSGAGASVLRIVIAQAEVYQSLLRGRFSEAARRQLNVARVFASMTLDRLRRQPPFSDSPEHPHTSSPSPRTPL
jgi:hypothetical protein